MSPDFASPYRRLFSIRPEWEIQVGVVSSGEFHQNELKIPRDFRLYIK
jgi:hypothetical protein